MNQRGLNFSTALTTGLSFEFSEDSVSDNGRDRYNRNRIPGRDRLRVLVIKLVEKLNESFPIKPCDGYVADTTRSGQKVQNPPKTNPVPKQQ